MEKICYCGVRIISVHLGRAMVSDTDVNYEGNRKYRKKFYYELECYECGAQVIQKLFKLYPRCHVCDKKRKKRQYGEWKEREELKAVERKTRKRCAETSA